MNNPVIIARHDTIGANAAEDDASFLDECFIDIGDLAVLQDCANPKRIVVGRTGSGKSALLATLCANEKNSSQLSVHSLSLNYLANNGVFEFYEELGVNLAVFYGLMWRHILVTALIQLRYEINSEEKQRDFVRVIRNKLGGKDKNKEFALEYLEKFNGKFWLTTEETTKEVSSKVVSELTANAGVDIEKIKLGANSAKSLTEEERVEIANRGREIVLILPTHRRHVRLIKFGFVTSWRCIAQRGMASLPVIEDFDVLEQASTQRVDRAIVLRVDKFDLESSEE